MDELSTIYDYMRSYAPLLGERILHEYPALQGFKDSVSPRLDKLLRKPKPAQNLAIMGVVKRWQRARTAMFVAECGTGKTLMSLAAVHVHSNAKPYTALAMVPPHLVEKWAREAFLTIPGIRVFFIDDLRNGGQENAPHGVNEVKLRGKRVVREGMQTTLSDMRLKNQYRSARKRWDSICSRPALFIVGRERGKLGYFWRHAYSVPRSGPSLGCMVNSDTGKPVVVDGGRLTVSDLRKIKISEIIENREDKTCKRAYSAMWQADSEKIQRMAPIEFIGRYMPGWFDYAICDEIHQLGGDTAQGNALGTLASCADRIVGLTGTLLGGYADDLFNTLYRLEARKMKEQGYDFGSNGRSAFAGDYGVLETITKIEPADNACSKAKATTMVRRKPGASPLLFGEFLMDLCAFVFLEDISGELPPYAETCLTVPMDPLLRVAYSEVEEAIRSAMKEHRGNRSVLSIMLHTLLLYPDHPYELGSLYGTEFDPQLQRKMKFLIAETRNLPQDRLYAKEQRLIEEIRRELSEGRKCQVFAVYTQKHDVTARLKHLLENEGIRTAVLKANVDTAKREAWYAKQVKDGVQVVIAHPKLVETGLDLLDFPTILFYESGYSLHTLRQASRRSWRIGQFQPVRVKFLCYEDTMQASCLRLMGRKLLVALTMEGKFAGEGLQSLDEDDDLLSAMARELVEKSGVGEGADAVWRSLNQEHQKLFPIVQHTETQAGDAGSRNFEKGSSEAVDLIEAAIDTEPTLVFGQNVNALRTPKRRSRMASSPEQASLFN
jgi:superfamily II DNA or RNA helicase